MPGFCTDQLTSASPNLLRSMLTTFVLMLMSAGGRRCLRCPVWHAGPGPGECRNGYRHRDFDTRAGTLDVSIPKLRQGSYFPNWLLERRRGAEAALTSLMAPGYQLPPVPSLDQLARRREHWKLRRWPLLCVKRPGEN